MRFNNRTGNRQSQTCTLRFCRKECVEDLVYILRRKSSAGIGGRDQHLTILGQLRLDAELTARVPLCSMPLSMRFINACCNWTRSAITLGSPWARSTRIVTEFRFASFCNITTIAEMTSFTSTTSSCEEPFWRSEE